MTFLLIIILLFFWILLIYYSVLTFAGIQFRIEGKRAPKLEIYPSVALFIPAHNEGLVLRNTLEAMMLLRYPGKLDIYVLNDNSTDNTKEIGEEFSTLFSNCHTIDVPDGEPKGKSRVLNYGIQISSSDYFVVYDADNQPDSDALTYLVEAAEHSPSSAGAIGYVRTINQNQNILTRMISIEFQVFQLLMQCGRWSLFGIGSLPGTNMLIKRSILDEIGGYDPYALAEDAELTIRITSKGYNLPIVPHAETWEQEPENIKVFIKQRTRWLIGNLYLLEKTFRELTFWKKKAFYHSMQHVTTYFLFVVLLFISNVWLVLSLIGVQLPNVGAPLLMIWFVSYLVYAFQVVGSMVFNKSTSLFNLLIGTIMYFTYAQLFLILLARAIYFYTISKCKNETIIWDKTKRFKGEPM